MEREPRPVDLPPGPGSVARIPTTPRGSEILLDRPFSPTLTPTGEGSPVEQVIVTSDELEAAFQPLAERETRRGIPTVIRTVSWIEANYPGIDAASRIRTFLRDAYDSWGTQWVVLGGDVEQVPTRWLIWSDEHLPVDAYYACLDREWNEDGDGVFAEPLNGVVYPDAFNDLASAPDGSLWAASTRGAARIDGLVTDGWDRRHGLPSALVHAIDVAPDGSVWAGTDAGIARFDGNEWIADADPAGPGSSVLSSVIAVSATEVWAAGEAGLFHLANGDWTSWGTADGIPTLPVNGIARDGDTLWMATAGGAVHLDAGVLTVYDTGNSGLLSNWVLSVSVDDAGRIWFGHVDSYFAQGGLSKLDGGVWSTDDFPAWSGLSVRDFVHGPAADEVWAATGKGLLHLTSTTSELHGLASGLPSADCFAVAATSGGIGVATSDGIGAGEVGNWAEYHSGDLGLPDNTGYDDADLYAELVVGRLPVSKPADVAVYLTKVENYQDGVLVDHVGNALFMGENLFTPGDGKELAQDAKALFPPSYSTTELYEVDGTQDVAAVKSALNSAPGIVVNVSHGSYDAIGVGSGLELLFNRDVRNLDTGGRSSFVVIYSCNSGAFDLESSAEAFLLHPDGGAIAVTANTREAVPPDDALINELMLDNLFTSDHGRPALALTDAFRQQVLADPSYRTTSWTRRTLLSRSYQGLPTLAIWRSAPGTLTVTHPATVPFERAPFAVNVTDAGSGLPVEGARVCVSLGDSDYAYGDTDAAGDVTFDFRPDVLGQVNVAVTTPDHVPYEVQVPVSVALGPNVVAAGWQPSPSRAGLNIGQNDVMLAVRNAGTASTAGWTAELYSEHAGATVESGTASVPALATGETAWVGPFQLALDSSVRMGERIAVRLEGAGEVPFVESYRLAVDVPDLVLDGIDVVGDEIFPRVRNAGTGSVGSLTATLTALDALGAVVDGAAAHGAVAAGAVATFGDGFTVTGLDRARFELTITDAIGRSLVRRIDREAPEPVWGLVAEPRFDGAFLTWVAPLEDDIVGYVVEVEDGSGGWIDEFAGLTGQGAMAHVRFPGGASRTCRVRAVDESGWIGPARTIEAYAAAAEFPGWPRAVPSLVGPAPIMVADLDGDLVPEIAYGCMWETNAVSVFRLDGTEWTDGDARPETDGVFGVTEGRIHAAPLLLDVDGDGQREIFAASFDGSVYAWRTDGPAGEPEALPGWPIFHTEKGVRSSPVGADLDGDGQVEIVTFAMDGEVRAFEADGTPVPGWPRVTGGFASGSTPAVFDLDGDGRDDLFFGATDSLLYAVSGTGADLPGWPQFVEAKVLCSPVLADIDGDDDPEVFAHTKGGRAIAYHPDGTVVSGWPRFIGVYGYTPPSPAVADLDQDGVPEILIGARDALYVLRTDASDFPGFPVHFGADVINSPVVADVDGDGTLDVLIATYDRKLNAIRVGGGAVDGWPLSFHENPWSTPFVMDMDGDGDLDLALGADDQTVHVLDLPGPDVPGAAPWPGYHGGADLRGVFEAPPLPTSPGVSPDISVSRVSLQGASPNPFRAGTDLSFAIPKDGPVRLEIYDVTGRRVARPIDGARFPAGAHRVAWDGRDGAGRPVASGVYFLRLEAAGESRSGKVIRLR